jgi:uncharacterized coiled-coil protein SlyX
MSLSNIHELEKIILRLNSGGCGGGGGNLEQRVTTLENQVTSINNTNTNQDQQIQNIQTQVNNINSTVNNHTTQISNLQNDITNINNTNTTQDQQITNLNNRVTALENSGGGGNLEQRVTTLENQVTSINNTNANQDQQITSINNTNNQQNTQIADLNVRVGLLEKVQIFSTFSTWSTQFINGEWTWYKLIEFENNGPGHNGFGLRRYILVVRNFGSSSPQQRTASLTISEGGFNINFSVWYFYNNTFSTAKADYTFSLDGTAQNLIINFEIKPPGQTFSGDSFFVQMWGF